MTMYLFSDIDITSGGDDVYEAFVTLKANWVELDALERSIATLANEATPTVADGRSFLTGGTTTITDFDDGETGQIIHVLAAHSLIITDGTNIFLSGSTNWTMTATDTLTLICIANNTWYELSRGDNGA
jgi:hypothetical protein